MKKSFIFVCLLLACNLLSAYTVKELYRKINNYENRHLFLYEAFDENENFIFYEIETQETRKGIKTEYRIRSEDVEQLKRFIIYLQKNFDKQLYSEAIIEYSESNEDLFFLWDKVELDPSYNTEIFCYGLK